jgi:hypothetical protein
MKGREIFYESFKTRIVEKATARLPRERFEWCEMVQEKWNSRASILVLEEKRGCFIGSKDGDGHLGAFVRRGDSIFFVSASADGSDRISRD